MSLAYTDAFDAETQLRIEEEIASRIFGGRPAAKLRIDADYFTWLACGLLSIVQLEFPVEEPKVAEYVDLVVEKLIGRARASLSEGTGEWFGEEDCAVLGRDILLELLTHVRPDLLTEAAGGVTADQIRRGARLNWHSFDGLTASEWRARAAAERRRVDDGGPEEGRDYSAAERADLIARTLEEMDADAPDVSTSPFSVVLVVADDADVSRSVRLRVALEAYGVGVALLDEADCTIASAAVEYFGDRVRLLGWTPEAEAAQAEPAHTFTLVESAGAYTPPAEAEGREEAAAAQHAARDG